MPSSDFVRTMDDVVESLRNAQGHGCSLLIGAGCSVSGGIPLAGGFVQEFLENIQQAYKRAKKKTYPYCMAELAPRERKDLIARFIDQARINWAHMAIAQLTKKNHVKRILTTNFDPLAVKACAMVGIYPAVYDLATAREFKAEAVDDPSVFYLHGQQTGFVMLHTEKEVQQHKKTLAPVFADAGKDRIWIVCGYSGDNDPVFDHLAEVATFPRNLYWIGYKDAPPPDHVREKLLVDDKFAFYVSGYDADSFFVELAQRLDCFPPEIISKPFTHLLRVTDLLAPFTIGSSTTDLREVARTRIQAAIDQFEKGEPAATDPATLQPDALDATALVFSGKYDEVLAELAKTPNPSEDLRDAAAWALIAQGNALDDQAKTKSGAEADALWTAAGEKHGAALQIKPDKHEALYNWGNVLAAQAKSKGGVEADALWAAAGKKYAAALQIKPDLHEALNNWGSVLDDQARTKSGAEADALWAAAREKYVAALQIKPDKHEALNNWGNTLLNQAKQASPERREKLLALVIEKCGSANKIAAGSGSYNLACAYALRGDPTACRRWLMDARDHGKLESREYMLNDSDFASVRDLAWFRELLPEK